MKLLVFSSLFPNNMWPELGVFVKERMVHLARQTHCEMKIVAPVPYYPPIKMGARWRFSQIADQETIDGFEVYHPRYFMIPKVSMVLYGWKMFLSVLPQMRRLKQHYPFDLIDAHFLYPDGVAATLLGRVLKTPVVVSARGGDVLSYSRLPLIRPLLRKALRDANHAIAVSHELKDAMIGLGASAEKITVIPNGVDSQKFNLISQEEARTHLGISHKKTILSVGHLVPGKGFDRLVVAFRDLCAGKADLDSQLYIVGEGPLRKELEGKIAAFGLEGRVHLVGHVAHQSLASWYSAADVFCLFSESEGCPNVVLESLACGTPVVATPVGEVPYLLRSVEVGLLARHEVQVMAQQLARALEQSWSRPAIREHALEHSWERVSSALLDVFTSVRQCAGGVV